MEFPVLQFVPIVSCPVSGHQWEKSDSIFFTALYQVFLNIDKIPLSLLFSKMNRTHFHSLSSYVRCSSSLIISVALCWTSPVFPCLSYIRIQHSRSAWPVLHRGEGSPPLTSAVVFISLNIDILRLTTLFILDFKNKHLFQPDPKWFSSLLEGKNYSGGRWK